MAGELTPRNPDFRLSNAEREQVMKHLETAVGEGRLTLDEFQERVDVVLQSRTYGEIERYLADLPTVVAALAPQHREVSEIRSVASPLRRGGRWNVPRRLMVRCKAAAVKLDFTAAVIAHPVVEIELNVVAGSTTLVLPVGASVNADEVEMIAGALRVRGLPTDPMPGQGAHFVVTGMQKAGSLTIRHQRRFWRWRW